MGWGGVGCEIPDDENVVFAKEVSLNCSTVLQIIVLKKHTALLLFEMRTMTVLSHTHLLFQPVS